MKPMSSNRGLLLLALFFGLGTSVSAQGIFDLAADFSLAGNPNGVWRYGTTGTTLTGSLTLFTATSTAYNGSSNIKAWIGSEPAFTDFYPAVAKNIANSNQLVGGGFVALLPGQLYMTPSPTGAYSVSRFTASVAGPYSINALFQGRDTRGATTDVHVLLNGVSLFDGIVNGFDTPSNQAFSGVQMLAVGDRIDFSVGYGPNLTFFSDSTAVAATIAAVPEPSTLICTALGAVGIALLGWKNRRHERHR